MWAVLLLGLRRFWGRIGAPWFLVELDLPCLGVVTFGRSFFDVVSGESLFCGLALLPLCTSTSGRVVAHPTIFLFYKI